MNLELTERFLFFIKAKMMRESEINPMAARILRMTAEVYSWAE